MFLAIFVFIVDQRHTGNIMETLIGLAIAVLVGWVISQVIIKIYEKWVL